MGVYVKNGDCNVSRVYSEGLPYWTRKTHTTTQSGDSSGRTERDRSGSTDQSYLPVQIDMFRPPNTLDLNVSTKSYKFF